jgi:signal transduction histidine kinase
LTTNYPNAGQSLAILAAITDGIIACNGLGKVFFANHTAQKILRSSTVDLVGKSVDDIFANFEEASRQRLLGDLMAMQKIVLQPEPDIPDVREVILEHGKRIINARLSVAVAHMVGPGGSSGKIDSDAGEAIGIVITLRDISKQAETDRAKSELISTVSHELRTPMTSINGYATLLRQGAVGPLTEKQQHFLDIISRNVSRLSMLINDLLDVSRIESGKVKLVLEEVNLASLAQDVVETLTVSAQRKGLRLVLTAPPNLPPVKADWGCITQVLINLIGNAITYTETGQIEVSLQAVASVMQVQVKDSGIGVSSEEVARIFDRFYRAERDEVRASTGTGLGLSIVKTYVEMHGGRIWVESELNKGSIFSFILPLASQEES